MGGTCFSFGGTEPYRNSSRCSGRRKNTKGQAEIKMVILKCAIPVVCINNRYRYSVNNITSISDDV